MKPQELAIFIDHTLLKPDSTGEQVLRLCREAKKYRFKAVCVLPTYVALAVDSLKGSGIEVATVAGFPLGAHFSGVKALEARLAFTEGASEVDMVINLGALKDRKLAVVRQDIQEVVNISRAFPKTLIKVILETGLLSHEEKILACQIAIEAGADFVKTSTGLNGGATVEDVALLARITGQKVKVKASGGIRTWEQAHSLIKAGASRLGTSNGVDLITPPLL